MKYIKTYESIDFDDIDDEEEDNIFEIGNKVVLREEIKRYHSSDYSNYGLRLTGNDNKWIERCKKEPKIIDKIGTELFHCKGFSVWYLKSEWRKF